MATYDSYKKIDGASIVNGTVSEDALGIDVRHRLCTKWITGDHGQCAAGCCCNWTVPSCTRKVFFELWGAGGNGSGNCSCSRCHHYKAAAGGAYNSKMVSTAPGCTYRVCAGGVYRCLSRECSGCTGCFSYVCGFNACNLCAPGGQNGLANTDWTQYCFSCWACCLQPVNNQGDFGMINHTPHFSGIFNCHCHHQYFHASNAPFMGGNVMQANNVCWTRCGCWIAPPAHGGENGSTSYCGRCCGQGGTGGPGVVKITFT